MAPDLDGKEISKEKKKEKKGKVLQLNDLNRHN